MNPDEEKRVAVLEQRLDLLEREKRMREVALDLFAALDGLMDATSDFANKSYLPMARANARIVLAKVMGW